MVLVGVKEGKDLSTTTFVLQPVTCMEKESCNLQFQEGQA